jgi:hypothetical protein
VATDRHGPYADHGEDLVIIQASHVGYNRETGDFGTYSRTQTTEHSHSTCCGKLAGILDWYLEQYRFAQRDVLLERCEGRLCLRIDNGLLRSTREEGLFLNLTRLIRRDEEGNFTPLHTHSTTKSFAASESLVQQLSDLDTELAEDHPVPIGDHLRPEMFFFRRQLDDTVEGRDHQELSLIYAMPWIVTSASPLLRAAQINTQVEFDRALRTVAHERSYRDKCLFYISGLNIDISPQEGVSFPTTKFVPWAAYFRLRDGRQRILEQPELISVLRGQSAENPDQIDLEEAIQQMSEAESLELQAPSVL